MHTDTTKIIALADRLVRRCGTRDPFRMARELGITVLYRPFVWQKGAYKIIRRNRFVFLKEDLDETMAAIVLLHEIGHDTLHREEAVKVGALQEFSLFDIKSSRMEYEANLFAAQASLPDEGTLDYIRMGYDMQQIAQAMYSDVNLVALKVDALIWKGYDLRRQEHRNDFLK